MEMPQLQSFDEVIKHLDTDKRQRHLLLGPRYRAIVSRGQTKINSLFLVLNSRSKLT